VTVSHPISHIKDMIDFLDKRRKRKELRRLVEVCLSLSLSLSVSLSLSLSVSLSLSLSLWYRAEGEP
jgi:hypothetical protein